MANAKQAKTRRLKMAERAAALQQHHFPGIAEQCIWHRTTNDGFTTVPRALPIAMQAVDEQSKGQPAGHVLFCLWCRAPDHPLVTIENPATFAAEAGFSGPRAVDTWRRRMKTLRELQFLLSKPGASGEFHYVMLLNPNTAVEAMRVGGKVQDGLYGRFLERIADIGAMSDIEGIHSLWQQQQAAMAAAAAAAPPAPVAPPPPIPPVAPPPAKVPKKATSTNTKLKK